MLNGYLLWETDTIIDQPNRWEMTVYLHESAPLDRCKVDVTPRHCHRFKVFPGIRFKWTNVSLKDGRLLQAGNVVADKWSLVTVEQVIVSQNKNRLKVERWDTGRYVKETPTRLPARQGHAK